MAFVFVGRAVAMILTFMTPVVLVRVFAPEDFGLYKQLLLISATLMPILSLGIPAGLFYFVPRNPEQRHVYIWQTVIALCLLGSLGGWLLVVFKSEVAAALNNPAVETYVPYLAFFVAMYLVASFLETLMIILRQARLSAMTIVGSELLRAAAVMAIAVWTQDLKYVVLALLAWVGCRLIALAIYLRRIQVSLFSLPRWDHINHQLRYSLPFGLALIVAAVADSLHLLVVSHLYDPVLFAVYAVGCLQVPLVAVAFSSIADVTLVRVTELRKEDRFQEVVHLIGISATKLCLILLPLYAWLTLNASDLIVLLFTEQFRQSVEVFIVFLMIIPLTAIGVDYCPQAFSDMRYLFRAHLQRLVLNGVLLWALIPVLGLAGAALASVLAMAVMKAVLLRRVSHLLRVPLRGLLPWTRLGGIFAVSLTVAVLAWIGTHALAFDRAGRLLFSGIVFVSGYGVLVWNLDMIASEEKQWVKRIAGKAIRFVNHPTPIR